jgi:hypothetical protein
MDNNCYSPFTACAGIRLQKPDINFVKFASRYYNNKKHKNN